MYNDSIKEILEIITFAGVVFILTIEVMSYLRNKS